MQNDRAKEIARARSAGWLAVASGAIGLLGLASLIAAVSLRVSWIPSSRVSLLFRAHDLGVVVQFLLLLPFALAAGRLLRLTSAGRTEGLTALGVCSIVLTCLLLLLGSAKIVSDMFYMLPQGFFGVWLILINSRLGEPLPRWLRIFGMVVGCGLVIVGMVFPGLAAFVYPGMLKIPAVPVGDDTFRNTVMNRVLHLMLAAGSLVGVATLPVWTVLAGSRLLGSRSRYRSTTAA